jgi:hypothetical protein
MNNKYFDKINIYINKLDIYLIKYKKNLKKIEDDESKSKDDKLYHLEPPFTNYCKYCSKKAAYIKDGYFRCWFHVY